MSGMFCYSLPSHENTKTLRAFQSKEEVYPLLNGSIKSYPKKRLDQTFHSDFFADTVFGTAAVVGKAVIR